MAGRVGPGTAQSAAIARVPCMSRKNCPRRSTPKRELLLITPFRVGRTYSTRRAYIRASVPNGAWSAEWRTARVARAKMVAQRVCGLDRSPPPDRSRRGRPGRSAILEAPLGVTAFGQGRKDLRGPKFTRVSSCTQYRLEYGKPSYQQKRRSMHAARLTDDQWLVGYLLADLQEKPPEPAQGRCEWSRDGSLVQLSPASRVCSRVHRCGNHSHELWNLRSERNPTLSARDPLCLS